MNKYEVDEILNLAIMSKTPHVILEGVDDIRIYEAIAESASTTCEFYSVEMIDGLAGGNDGVIQAMEAINSLNLPAGKRAEHFVMGVIDRDARFYRNEVPNLPSIFSLKFYSIESHFVSIFAIKPSINRLTRISSSDEIDSERIYSKINRSLLDVYYFSLEALKNSLTPGYQTVVGFSSSIGRRKDGTTISELQFKKDDLDVFASTLSLAPNIESMRKFSKGKWLLTAFVEELFKEIERLVADCKQMAIKQCRMCELDGAAPCLYQLRGGLNKNSLYSIVQDFIDIPDFDYIKDKLKAINVTAAA